VPSHVRVRAPASWIVQDWLTCIQLGRDRAAAGRAVLETPRAAEQPRDQPSGPPARNWRRA